MNHGCNHPWRWVLLRRNQSNDWVDHSAYGRDEAGMGNVRYSNTATSSHRTQPSRFCNAVLSANLDELVQRTREGRVCVWKGIIAWEASNNQSCKLQEEEAVDICTLFTHRNISYDLLQGTLDGRRRRERSGHMWLLLSCPLHNVLPLAGACICQLCHYDQVVSRTGLV